MRDFIEDVPFEHRLPFAVFHCKRQNICPYEALAAFRGIFEAVQWFTEWARQSK